MTFRGTYAQAVRAPNIAELFSPESSTFNFIIDPCDINETNNGTSTREANCAELLEGLGIDPDDLPAVEHAAGDAVHRGHLRRQSRAQRGNGDDLDRGRRAAAGVRAGPDPGVRLVRHRDRGRDQHARGRRRWRSCASTTRRSTTRIAPASTAIRTRVTSSASPCGPTTSRASRTAGLDVALDYQLDTEKLGGFKVQLVGGYLDRLEFVSVPGAEVDNDLGESSTSRSFRRRST